MLSVHVGEIGRPPLPAVGVDGDVIVIGSSPSAQIRLPASDAAGEHVRVVRENGALAWEALAPIAIDGARKSAGERGEIRARVVIEIGKFHVAVGGDATGAVAATPQRTESLARELVRGLLGEGGAPVLEVEVGPHVGAKRALPPPEATVVIGRGDEATWVILDEDLSRAHAEVRRTWDGVRIVDLGSKNGTRVDGDVVDDQVGRVVRDGALIELGKVQLRFRDPAERHLGGRSAVETRAAVASTASVARVAPVAAPTRSRAPMLVAIVIALGAIAGLIWLLAS